VFNDHVSTLISAKETCIVISCLCALLSIHHGICHHDLVCMTLFLLFVMFIIMILSSWLCFFSPLSYAFIFCLFLLCLIMFYSPMVFIIISCPSSSNPSLFPPLFIKFYKTKTFNFKSMQGHAFQIVFHFLLIVVPCASKVMPRLTLWHHNRQGLISI